MKILSMRIEVVLEQPVDKEKSYATIGGFAFRYADGTEVTFDFENSEGWLQPKGDSIVFELNSLDNDCSNIPEGMTAEEFVCPTEVVEFYHEFLKDGEKNTGTVEMKGILWWTFLIDGREYSIPREVLEKYHCGKIDRTERKVSLAAFASLLSNGSNGQFLVVAFNGNLNNLVYVGKVENLIDNLAEQYLVTSVCNDLVFPDLVKLILRQKFKQEMIPDIGAPVLVIGVEDCVNQ